MLAGVAAGIAQHFNIDVTIVRVVFAVLAIVGFTGLAYLGGLPLYLGGIPLYLACWLLIPEEGSEHSIASALLRNAQSRSAPPDSAARSVLDRCGAGPLDCRLAAGRCYSTSVSPSNLPRSSRYSSRPTPFGSRKYMLLSAPRSGPR